MNRKFKLAGVLMAVVAMFALTASSASAAFTSTVSPNSGTATSTGDTFDAFGSTVKCTNNSFNVGTHDADPAKATSSPGVHNPATFPTNTLTVVPTYSKCTAFGLPATVNFTGCDYVFHSEGAHPESTSIKASLVCPPGVTGVDINVYSSESHATAICHVVVHPFATKGGLTATNNGAHVDLKGTVEGITATQVRTNGVLCPPGTHTAVAKYTVQAAGITIIGKEGAVSVS